MSVTQFSCIEPLRWSDMDAYGHVNNSVYFTYLEQGRIKWWAKLGVTHDGQEEGPVVMTANCVFLYSLEYREHQAIKIDMVAHTVGRSSFIIDYVITTHDEAAIKVATASTKIVWVNYKKRKSIRIPDFIRQHF